MSVELAIYNYNKTSGPFWTKGDSGSLIFDGLGRMLAFSTLGSRRAIWEVPASPMLPLFGGSLKYPHADFNRIAW